MPENRGWWASAWRRVRTDPGGSGRAALPALLGWMRHYLHGIYAVAGVLLSTGLILALLGLWALAELTEEVLEGETLRFDQGVLLWMDARATEWLDVAALEVTALGDTLVVLVVAVVAGTLLWLLGQRGYAALIGVAVSGAWIIYPVLKLVFDRPRPRLFEWRAHYAGSTSYPSGHATMSMVLLVVLAYIVHRLSGRRRTSVAAMALAGIVVLLIGLSRLYLGVHYPSDVLAGYAVGFAWTVFCAVATEALRQEVRGQPESEAVPSPPRDGAGE